MKIEGIKNSFHVYGRDWFKSLLLLQSIFRDKLLMWLFVVPGLAKDSLHLLKCVLTLITS